MRASAATTAWTRELRSSALGRKPVAWATIPSDLPSVAIHERTASRSVLLGIVPVSMHTPPTIRRFSTTAARFPSFAACTAARCPAGPLPMATRS